MKAINGLIMDRLSVVWLVCLVWPLVSPCSVDICSREYGSVLTVPQQEWSESSSESTLQYCSILNAYQQCLKSINKSCRGNLEFHTLVTLLKNWKNDKNCSQNSNVYSGKTIPKLPPKIWQKTIPSTISQTNVHWRPYEDRRSPLEIQEALQTCVSAAYNYTINVSNDAENPSVDERTRLVNTEQNSKPRRIKNRDRRTRRDISSKFVPISGEAVDLDEEVDKDVEPEPSPPTVPSSRPLMPPSPPLTCIIYGDPHLRTLNNEYQTCRCAGAWPLIDHPLFAVQITNSRIKGSNPQIYAVTKATVLIRRFTKCGILNDLVYEADSQSTPGLSSSSPAATFIDGSTSSSNNLIRITQSSNNNVVTISLDHIGVRIYIGQIESAYLNVVIKFRSAHSTVKQQLVLKSISDNSLCKSGCPKRERIDIQSILKAANVDISANSEDSAQHLDNTDSELKSDNADSSVIDNNEETDATDDQTESGDPCHELSGYYRISCLYDKTIKGVKHVNNANRFAQSFDEKRFIDNSILVNSAANSESNLKTNSSSALTPNHCLNYILLFVISLIIRFL